VVFRACAEIESVRSPLLVKTGLPAGNCTKIAFNTSNKFISNSLTKTTMTIQKWLTEEKMRLARFKICCVNAQKKEAKSFPLKMPRSCWSGQYRTWDDSLDA
jgi:hypothetical protein